MAGACLTPEQLESMYAAYRDTGTIAETARVTGISWNTVKRYVSQMLKNGDTSARPVAADAVPAFVPAFVPATLPEPAAEAGGATLPDAIELKYETFDIDTPGNWLILNDVHIPYHDKRCIELAVADAKKRNTVGVLLNGDIMDCAGVSDHFREPNVTRLEDEIDKTIQFLKWLRSHFPQARIVYKEGNHEWRLPRYIANYAPELFGLKQLRLPNLLELDSLGVEWVADKRLIQLGKLSVVHGHEFRGGGGVNPARWLWLRAGTSALCGHFHRSSGHDEQTLDRKVHSVWSVGCACFLYPQYDPNNKWVHGWASVEVFANRHYLVTNRKVLRDGSIA